MKERKMRHVSERKIYRKVDPTAAKILSAADSAHWLSSYGGVGHWRVESCLSAMLSGLFILSGFDGVSVSGPKNAPSHLEDGEGVGYGFNIGLVGLIARID
ncbi:hypothetical protein I7I48_11029 [Histoplasma ohiense]|nr:hypothetical protein I7I48_11029 [Histoplasma ohiense (nom. inval.)]